MRWSTNTSFYCHNLLRNAFSQKGWAKKSRYQLPIIGGEQFYCQNLAITHRNSSESPLLFFAPNFEAIKMANSKLNYAWWMLRQQKMWEGGKIQLPGSIYYEQLSETWKGWNKYERKKNCPNNCPNKWIKWYFLSGGRVVLWRCFVFGNLDPIIK